MRTEAAPTAVAPSVTAVLPAQFSMRFCGHSLLKIHQQHHQVGDAYGVCGAVPQHPTKVEVDHCPGARLALRLPACNADQHAGCTKLVQPRSLSQDVTPHLFLLSCPTIVLAKTLETMQDSQSLVLSIPLKQAGKKERTLTMATGQPTTPTYTGNLHSRSKACCLPACTVETHFKPHGTWEQK